MTAGTEGLRLEHLTRRFGDGTGTVVHAVEDVSLVVRRGELVVVIGPSGSGKTTLLSLAAGLLPPDGGEVTVDGLQLGTLSQAQLTAFRLRRIGFVFQTFHLIDALPVAENIELPLNLAGVRRPASRETAIRLAERLGLADRIAFRPQALSGGEKQRVAIARSLVNDPPVLLADEPTGSLDSRAGQVVIELLHAAAHEEGKAVLVVSHDPRICRFADQVVQMEDGRITQPAALPSVSS